MVFQVYKSFSVKFCTIMTFQGSLIKFGTFGSVLLGNSNDIETAQSML